MDTELLKAIEQIIKSEVQPLKNDVSGLKEGMTGIKEDVNGLKGDVAGLKGDVAGLKEDVREIKNDVSGLKEEVTKTNLIIETEIRPNIRLLAEGHMGIISKLDNISEKVDEIDDIKNTVEILKLITIKK